LKVIGEEVGTDGEMEYGVVTQSLQRRNGTLILKRNTHRESGHGTLIRL